MTLAELDLTKSYTYADYLKWKFDERIELINGKIFTMSPSPNIFHQEITGEIFYQLKSFLDGKVCRVFVAPFDVRLSRKSKRDEDVVTVLQPDVCVVCDTSILDAKGCNGTPDIIVEVLSPGNNSKELKNKYNVYEEAGVREYWIVSPQNETVITYVLDNGKFVAAPPLVAGDILTSLVLPGFSLNLEKLFRLGNQLQ